MNRASPPRALRDNNFMKTYTKEEAKNEAIDRISGEVIQPGKVVAHRSFPLTVKFVKYDGEDAVCETVEGEEKRFPKAEIFDVNKVVNVANHLLNVGFWNEGMESRILTIQ